MHHLFIALKLHLRIVARRICTLVPFEQRFASKCVLHPIGLLLVLDSGRRPWLRHETELVVLDRELVLERLKFGGS